MDKATEAGQQEIARQETERQEIAQGAAAAALTGEAGIEHGSLAEVYAEMSMRAAAEAVRVGVEVGTKVAERRLEEGRREQVRGRYDRRVRNTRYLLANYRNLKDHVRGAVHSGRRANESAIDILDGLDGFEYEENYYIQSIKQSQQRTLIILTHIEEMLNLWRISCEQSQKPEEMRRYRVVHAAYIDPEKKTVEEITQENGIEKGTYYKDLKKAMKPLSALIFGIDGMRLA